MRDGFSIVTPAFEALDTLTATARSVVGQTVDNWEWIIVADDANDYQTLLARIGITDPRIRFLQTGEHGSGSPGARNLGIAASAHRFGVILDADDVLDPHKLERVLPGLIAHGLVSTALNIVDAHERHLRYVGASADKLLTAATYKFTNFSMDSMLCYDRKVADPRFDPNFPSLTDIDFALKLFGGNRQCFHIGTPLHSYRKRAQSISNKPGASAQYVDVKTRLLHLLSDATHYPLAQEADRAGMLAFWQISREAELSYGARLAAQPGLLFEDHIEPRLTTASTSAR